MKKNQYIAPKTSIVLLNISDPVLEVGDLFDGSAGEDSHEGWFGAKENAFFDDDEQSIDAPRNNSVWEEDE